MGMRKGAYRREESGQQKSGKGTIVICELVERDPFTGKILRSERHEILAKIRQL
ncbi:hypothetical protein NTE_01568 [Candidatus Nitrososphaera evergladensis SR1]|jgi:hypothetical protein|uniref:Uncharacterized protein n=1 Tax=Candidatus Nitrososphaera evergladensis SR1 TaxID=1459636 RepID=A0A075MPY4_9ARCH|nr:hypothetical protein [Candidatus Nitrososphaera evergladensis]AIF83631.1 hypothetical protein NTE_01568 [Candidatus Nitrososphaera evergladensis SR1]